ncbi:VOC family protein [soil metagenome]
MAQVKAVPDGLQTVTPFLNIKNAAEAIELYKKAFGAEVRESYSNPDGKIMMCELQIGTSVVRVSDAIKDAPTQSGLSLYVENADAWWQRAIDAGLEVVMPLQDMFWGDRFGAVRDPFGNMWSIATHIEDVSHEEGLRRAAAHAMKSK